LRSVVFETEEIMMHPSLIVLKSFLLNPSLDTIPSEIDIKAAEKLLGCDEGRLIKDQTDLWMQSQDPTAPMYYWARKEDLCTVRMFTWRKKYFIN
jgi:hypothetical protein